MGRYLPEHIRLARLYWRSAIADFFAFLVGQNQYFLTAERVGYQSVKTEVIDFTKVPEPAVLAKDIELAPAPAVGQGTAEV